MMTETSVLFTPTRLGAVEIPNRVLMAPMTRSRAGRDGVPGPLAARYYAQRASAGLIVTEATQVAPEGQGYIRTPGIHDAAQAAGWRKVTDAVHAAGGRIFLQLWHVGRVSHESFQPGGGPPVSASAVRLDGEAWTYEGTRPHPTPRALATDEVPGVVAQFRTGAVLAKEAGFDGVEIHGANGYLIDQFLRDGTNRRDDRYGGSAANRARFLLEVTDAVVAVWGADRVGVRLSPLGTFNGMSDSDPATTFGTAVAALDGFGLAYLHLVEQFGAPLSEADQAIIEGIRGRWHGAYIANGAYDAARGAAAVASGWATAVAYGVPFIANPDLPLRLLTGAELAASDEETYYAGDAKGYVDYPPIAEQRLAA
jgi:N-ethylmaleimide reductase